MRLGRERVQPMLSLLPMYNWWCEVIRIAAQTANLMVGIPDYDTYVEHRLTAHPGEPIMTQEEFIKNRQECRYSGAGGGINRCC